VSLLVFLVMPASGHERTAIVVDTYSMLRYALVGSLSYGYTK